MLFWSSHITYGVCLWTVISVMTGESGFDGGVKQTALLHPLSYTIIQEPGLFSWSFDKTINLNDWISFKSTSFLSKQLSFL